MIVLGISAATIAILAMTAISIVINLEHRRAANRNIF
ncbi:hypothetical protein ABIA16_003685 [Sinorhizobium fredii]